MVSLHFKYKLLVLTHLGYHYVMPSYLAELIQTQQERSLRNVHVYRLELTPLSFHHCDH